uniref:DUF4371 domain-containing protein n=1 Tax=Dicentrarchus labrax TaxID=13489 RepID=A0A8P4G627_DICLA
MVSIMLDETSAAKLKAVPLSNDTVARRICNISSDLEEQLNATDRNKDCLFISYVRFVNGESLCKDLLFCKYIKNRQLNSWFKIMDSYLKEHGLKWGNCAGFCSDGAQTMAGSKNGLKIVQHTFTPLFPTPAPNLTYADKVELETGYTDKNEWLEWVRYTALSTGNSDCIACAKARPSLGTMPSRSFRLSDQIDPTELACVVKLFSRSFKPTEAKCKTLALRFPSVTKNDVPPSIVVYPGNYTCFTRTGQGIVVKSLPASYCSATIDITSNSDNYTAISFIHHDVSRADLWWLCGDRKLYPHLPPMWSGTCALTQLVMPFQVFPTTDYHRGSFDKHFYIDSIGVPRHVPDEFKARNQIAAGFESVIIWWSSINKNVDWINYIYYNQQRFVSYTRDAVKGISEQLGPTSLMAWQNRMALDMLLAEKGVVCKMFGLYCCTFIPNNTAPDGSITKALAGLTSLSEELAENALISSLFISLTTFTAILVCCGCCCIPCLRTLVNRLITTSLSEEKNPSPPPYQMPLLAALDGMESELDIENGVDWKEEVEDSVI